MQSSSAYNNEFNTVQSEDSARNSGIKLSQRFGGYTACYEQLRLPVKTR